MMESCDVSPDATRGGGGREAVGTGWIRKGKKNCVGDVRLNLGRRCRRKPELSNNSQRKGAGPANGTSARASMMAGSLKGMAEEVCPIAAAGGGIHEDCGSHADAADICLDGGSVSWGRW